MWRRSLFDLEKAQVCQLLKVVHDSCPILEKVDRWVWKANKFQEFSVNSIYRLLRGLYEGDDSRMFNSSWRIKALPSGQVTTWRVQKNRIGTKVELHR